MTHIIWSEKAAGELRSVVRYWTKRNKSDTYSRRIIGETNRILGYLLLYPEMGISTDFPDVRMRIVLKNYFIFCSFKKETLYVLKFWDTRQNPRENEFLK
jgi:hypothetical protein